MKRIGTFVGHALCIGKARLLYDSLCQNTDLIGQYQFTVMTPEHLNLTVEVRGIEQINFDLPEEYKPIPFVDKLLAAAEFERCCDDEYLWIDVDSCFFKTPVFPDAQICVNPVDMKNIGVSYGEPLSPMWRLIYDDFGLDIHGVGSVKTIISKDEIYPYYNAGMIRAKKPDGLFSEVRTAMTALLKTNEIKNQISSPLNRIFFHQAVFSCAIMKKYGKTVSPLPYGVNYPLHLRSKDTTPIPLEDIVSIRYDDYFDENEPPERWADFFKGREDALKSVWYYQM
ncbi:MAG TPA: hypothetical protein PK629_10025 [Oscillospiraceae bacterium]|nr:hypothetical protein [Oscillospiraceae bacterium]HPF57127.1 hypothetical protein [Clostridiales bacterium]HPK36542.1 hypothetical protein [Oscillospiraceae bacterium]HPR75519.1 hypothetical protein [Oscillospiraceae bacterium]